MTSTEIAKMPTPPTRRSLLLRLKNWHDEQSWQEFYHIYERLIRDAALKAGLSPEEAQEAMQETLLTVAKKIAGFNYDPQIGSFKNWLLQITKRRVVDQFRKRRPDRAEARVEAAAGALDQLPDPAASRLDALWNAEWHQALLGMAQALVRRRVGAKQFQMFELYVLQQRPLQEVRRALGVSAAQVYMAKYRITRLLKKEVRQLEEIEV
jgi:RNA polymerase sigma-70 factor (ECF subfamily)